MLNTRSIKLSSIPVYCSQFRFPFHSSLLRLECRQAQLTLRSSLAACGSGLRAFTARAPVLSLVGDLAHKPCDTANLHSRLRVGLTPLTLQFPSLERLLLEKQKGRLQMSSHFQPQEAVCFPSTTVNSIFMT